MNARLLTPLLLMLMCFGFQQQVTGQAQGPEQLALRFLEDNLETLNLTQADLQNARVRDLYLSKHNGVTHVFFNQTHAGIDVFNAIFNANVSPEGEIFHYGNRFYRELASRINATSPSLTPIAAIRAVQNQLVEGVDFESSLIQKERDGNRYTFDGTGIALEDVIVELVYQPMPDKTVRLAWRVEYYQTDAQHWWNARVDAQTGEILANDDQVISCSFGNPDHCADNTHIHYEAKPEAVSFKSTTNANEYNVWAEPIESPNHGNRSIQVDPAANAPAASPFGWHDTNGQAGAEFTITRGNNVHAYQDIFANNSSQGDEPDGGSSLIFDFPINEPAQQPYTHVEASVVNLFYWNNLVHDVWYRYGFDEQAGNFQQNNYGNGGQSGDYVRAEAMDGSGTNNANWSSGGDGSTARMQMFLWTNDPLPSGGSAILEVTAPGSIAGDIQVNPGGFGGTIPTTPIISELVLFDDGTGVTSDACEDPINGPDMAGKIALIDRGDCEFGSKILRAENAGAIAVIMCNNVAGGTVTMAPGADGAAVTIPAGMITLADCNTIKMEMPGVQVEFSNQTVVGIPIPGPSGLDGDLDNGIIAHEYGHGISIRGTGGPSTGSCLNNTEQMGEGWSDYFGAVMTIEPGDQGTDIRGIGTYATGQPTTGGGIRPFPYTTNMNINPHTYEDIDGVSIPHGVGSVWAEMLWEMTWALIDEYNFDPNMYNGTGGNNIAMQLVMDGIKLQSCNPGFVDGRDAILAADVITYGGVNQCLIWEAFAKRGLGFFASQGSSQSVNDAVQNFDVAPFCLETLKIEKTADGEVTEGGTITYTIEVTNDFPSTLNNVTITDPLPQGTTFVPGSSSCGGTENGGILTINLGSMPSGTTQTCTFEVDVTGAPGSQVIFEDGFENGIANWNISNPVGPATWVANTTNPFEGNTAYFAADIDESSDQLLELANPIQLTGNNPRLAFWHEYNTESGWDGGVVEISVDGGAWADVGPFFTQNGYTSALNENPDSPISGREAFHGSSNGYIQSIADLSNFSGQSIQVRFR
ncbi:MAG: T9SS-dependent M36 family metallopeptidase, partial [Bacteroidota bacterium]